MSIEIVESIELKLKKGFNYEEVISWLVMNGDYNNKSEARIVVEGVCDRLNISKKRLNKSEELKKWFLDLDDCINVKNEDVKKKCEEIGMKGGSVAYYVNSYKLVIELYKLIKIKEEIEEELEEEEEEEIEKLDDEDV